MKKLYEKNELTFALLWIVVYCVLQSLANPLNKRIGVEYSASAAFCILQAAMGRCGSWACPVGGGKEGRPCAIP